MRMTSEPAALSNSSPGGEPLAHGTILASASGPVADESRLLGLDVSRAVALLGIFFVNASIFGLPFAKIMNPSAPTPEAAGGPLGMGFYWFTMVFCAGKFYPLFSILFGVGLAIMFDSSRAAGRKFHWAFLRRLLMLGAFGVAHIVLLWPGDILLIYAGVGLWMLLLGPCRPSTLLTVGGVVFGIGLVLAAGFTLLGAAGGGAGGEPTPKVMPEGATVLERWVAVLKDWNQTEPYDSRMLALETEMIRDGPFVAALVVRLFNYLFTLVYVVLVMFWNILACFCLGAALLKSGFFHGRRPGLRRVLIGLGLGLGLPLSILATYAAQQHGEGGGGGAGWMVASTLGFQIGGPLMSLMYLSLIMAWAESGRAAGLARTLAHLGRMGLTGYLLESLLMCAIMAHWGLAKFGSTTWAERGVLVLAIYLLILGFAQVWMRAFRFGPLEWAWRSWTYLKVQRLRAG